MSELFVVLLALISSAAAVAAGTKRLGLPLGGLLEAGLRMCEAVGLGVLFFVFNIVIGMALVLTVRAFTNRFVSLYELAEETLPVLSMLQGLTLWHWRRSAAAATASRPSHH